MCATRPLVEDATVRYVIDTAGSTFTVKAFSAGLLSAFAHNPKIAIRDFQGEVSFTPAGGTLEGAYLNIRVRTGSLEVVDDVSEKDIEEINHKMLDEVLETDRFPEVLYESSRIAASGAGDRFWAALRGDLSLHGVTNPLSITARVAVNGSSLRASGEFTLRQTDFGITLVSAAGGTIRVKDEVKCAFDVVAKKQE